MKYRNCVELEQTNICVQSGAVRQAISLRELPARPGYSRLVLSLICCSVFIACSNLCVLSDPPKHCCPYENCNFAVFEKSKLQQHIRIRHTEKVWMSNFSKLYSIFRLCTYNMLVMFVHTCILVMFKCMYPYNYWLCLCMYLYIGYAYVCTCILDMFMYVLNLNIYYMCVCITI